MKTKIVITYFLTSLVLCFCNGYNKQIKETGAKKVTLKTESTSEKDGIRYKIVTEQLAQLINDSTSNNKDSLIFKMIVSIKFLNKQIMDTIGVDELRKISCDTLIYNQQDSSVIFNLPILKLFFLSPDKNSFTMNFSINKMNYEYTLDIKYDLTSESKKDIKLSKNITKKSNVTITDMTVK